MPLVDGRGLNKKIVERKDAYRVLVGKPEEKKQLRKHMGR